MAYIALFMAIVLIGRAAIVQLKWGPQFASQAADQRTRVFVDYARRGEIVDAKGESLAYTVNARTLTAAPNVLREELRYVATQELQSTGEYRSLSGNAIESRVDELVEQYLKNYAEGIPAAVAAAQASNNEVSSEEILKKLHADSTYEVLIRSVDPDVAETIADDFPGIASDMEAIREYPNGAVGENVIGKVGQDGLGQFGLESSLNTDLSGLNGRYTMDVSTDGQIIPGTVRDVIAAQNGAKVELTLDLELQTYVQQQLEQAKGNSGAESASAVVLDAHTGEVLAMANTDTINPNGDIQAQLDDDKIFDNLAISAPFEPGSVAKIITAAGVIEDGLATPDEVLQVPGSIDMAGVTVRDAWEHGVVGYTTTGVFGKSSNVGTLMLAQRLGEERYNELLEAFGIGQSTGIELPGESQGLLPALEQWSGGTFANLPIGQGMSWTTLQMASVYQTIANGGVRVEPRIVDTITDASGNTIAQDAPAETKVVSPETARTVLDMFRAIVQSDPTGVQSGTGSDGAVEGYQISGKTGTAQQVDPDTGAYSNSKYWITFAGVAPADNPRFVVALMLDKPVRGVHGQGGQSAAPLFSDIATWLLDRENVPLSAPMEGQLILQAQ
ncbi:MAG: penicillin-binding protein 2 [Corynebacterium sp.]|nr:penicillin-binding protein 2 [Corynebacterium sp.]